MAALPAMRLRSDTERKRLYGLAEDARSGSEVGSGIYTETSSEAVYEYLAETAGTLLDAGHNVILDATFLRAADRATALQIADSMGVAAVIVEIRAPDSELRRRLEKREQGSADVSEAGLDVLEFQRNAVEVLSAQERERRLVFENDRHGDIDELCRSIRRYREGAQRPGATPHSAKSFRRH